MQLNPYGGDWQLTASHVYYQVGTFPATLYVTGPDGQTASWTALNVVVDQSPKPSTITFGGLSPTQWQENQLGYDGTIPVNGGAGGYQNLQISGLPPGLSATILSSTINGQQSGTITISGTPTQSGTFTLTTTLQDGKGDTGTGTETLTITAAPPTPNPPSTPPPPASYYPTSQPNYGVAPRNDRVPMTTKAQRIAWRRLALSLANDMRSFLEPGDGLRVTSIIKAGEHNNFQKMDVVPTGGTTWEELAFAASRAGFWVHAEGVTLGGVHWPLSPRATGPHLDLYHLRQ